MLDALDLARVQFALTASVHFLFVMVTLGLVTLLVIIQTRFVRTGKPVYERMARFWGLLYVINYAVGIAAGLIMEFQFGLNWSGLQRITGDVFGAPLALETLVAFVLESTLLGMWIFGWGRLGRRLHLALIWGVAITAYLSAFWIMVANAFLQHPVGYELTGDGRARLTDLGALLGNGSLWFALAHIVFASIMTGGFVMAGISAYHLFRRHPEYEFFQKSLRLGVVAAFVACFLLIGVGYAQFVPVTQYQPTKLGGAESEATVARFVEQFGPGIYEPPRAVVGASLGWMIMAGNLLFLITFVVLILLIRDVIIRNTAGRLGLILIMITVPLPFVTAITGWLVREIGRQPWAVYGVLKTEDALSPMSPGTLALSMAGSLAVIVSLAVVDWWLLARSAMRGPGNEFLPVAAEPVDEPIFAGRA